jgi:hypothetical protein
MNLKQLSQAVFKLNYTDETSEDYVYFQIITYLAEFGSFTLTELNKQILFKKKSSKKIFYIERRKLKKILHGTDKNFKGLIPLNYVIEIPASRNRGGNQEHEYYLTEKGIMASLGYFSYKQNINLKKFFKSLQYPNLKPYKKFIEEFVKLQISVFLFYHYVQGISLAFKHEHNADYDKFRSEITQSFDIRVSSVNEEEQFNKLLDEFNLYRKIHRDLISKFPILSMVWHEPYDKKISQYGFQGWCDIQFFTRFDKNLKLRKYRKRKTNQSSTNVTLVSEPKFIYSRFQENSTSISNASLDREMIHLGLKKPKNKANLQNRYLDDHF